jgi:hypothetical protein
MDTQVLQKRSADGAEEAETGRKGKCKPKKVIQTPVEEAVLRQVEVADQFRDATVKESNTLQEVDHTHRFGRVGEAEQHGRLMQATTTKTTVNEVSWTWKLLRVAFKYLLLLGEKTPVVGVVIIGFITRATE